MYRLRIDKQLSRSAGIGYLMISDTNGEYNHIAPGNEGDSLIVNNAGNLIYDTPIKIATGSQGRLVYNATTRELGLTALGVMDVFVDNTATSLSDFVTTNYTGSEYQKGDFIVLTAPTGGTQTYLHNGGNAADITDFTTVELPNLDEATIKAFFSSANDALGYDNSTGIFTIKLDQAVNNDLSIIAGASGGLRLSVREGLVVDTENLVAGSTGGTTEVQLQDLLNAIATASGGSGLPAATTDGQILYYDGTNFTPVIKVIKTFTPANGDTTVDLVDTPVNSLLVIVYSNGLRDGDLTSNLTGTVLTLPFQADGTDVFEVVYYKL